MRHRSLGMGDSGVQVRRVGWRVWMWRYDRKWWMNSYRLSNFDLRRPHPSKTRTHPPNTPNRTKPKRPTTPSSRASANNNNNSPSSPSPLKCTPISRSATFLTLWTPVKFRKSPGLGSQELQSASLGLGRASAGSGIEWEWSRSRSWGVTCTEYRDGILAWRFEDPY
jgi:hypothetical protein